METQLLEQAHTETEYKTEIKELALTDNASGYLYLRDGKMAVAFNSLDTADFALPLTVTHVHKQGVAETAYGQNWRLNVNKKLKLNTDDTEKNTRYVYTDELGDAHVFSEEYYYMEGSTQKQIEDKSQINIDGNGVLTYNGKQVYKKQYCKGYTLIPEINDYKGCELIEQRVDERIELEEYVLKTEPELKGYVRVNAASGAPSENNVNFTAAGSLTKESCEAFLNGVTANSDDIIIEDTELLKWSAENKQTLIATARKNLEKVKYEFSKYFKKKAELDLLLLNTPVCYLKDGSGIINGFNASGDLVCIIDGYGRYLAIDYGAGGRINSIYDGNGTAAEFTYDNGLLKSITDKLGRKTAFTYTQNLLTKVSFADGSTITFAYTSGQITKVSSSDYQEATLYYSGGKLSSAYSKMIGKRGGNISSGVISSISISYESNKTTLSQNGETESFTFNEDGRVATHSITDKLNKSTTVTYTYTDFASGYSVKATTSDNAGSQSTTVTKWYDIAEKITREETAGYKINGYTTISTETIYTYDDNDRLIQKRNTKYIEIVYDPDDDDSTGYSVFNYMEKYKYDIHGNLVLTESYEMGEEKTSGINYEERVYNDSGVMVKCIRWNSLDSSSKFYEDYETEKDGRVKYEKDETGAYSAMYEYADGKNVVNSVTYANGGKIAYGRNPHTNEITSVTASTADGEANTNEIAYECGLPVKMTSGNATLEYSYDAKGRKTAVNVNGTEQCEFRYDDTRDYIGEEGYYDLGGNTQILYPGSGNVVIKTTKQGFANENDIIPISETLSINGTDTNYIDYRTDGKVARKHYLTENNQPRYDLYKYNTYGRLTQVQTTSDSDSNSSNAIITENYGYDDFGALRSKKITGEVGHTYYYIRKHNYAHDLDYVTCEIVVNPNTTVSYVFKPLKDVNGRNTGREITNGSNKIAGEYITYRKVSDHATNMPAIVRFTSGTQTDGNIKYKYDSCGNISEVIKDDELKVKYTYDQFNRLAKEENNEFNKTTEFEYDTNGNILRKRITKNGDSTTKEYKYVGDKLVSYDGEACEYNSLGNPTTYRGKVCEWQYGKLLTRYHHTFITYDSLGRRVKKGGTTFTYDSDGRLIKQSNGLEFFYDESGVAGLKYDGAIYFYRKDAQGNIIAILNSESKVVVKYQYDAWGNHETFILNRANDKTFFEKLYAEHYDYPPYYQTFETIGKINPFCYRGYYYDTETGLYYLQSRYYDPEVGRFISQDSIEYADPETINGLNLYAYCGNNPVMNVDPTGNAWWHWLLGAFAVVALCAVAVGVTVVTGGTGTLAFAVAAGALKGAAIGLGVGAVAGTAFGAVAGGIYAASTGGDFWTGVGQGALLGLGIGAFAGAVIGAVVGGIYGGISYLDSTTALYRAVDINEYNSIRSSGQFSLKNGAMEGKQFGLKLNEVRNYARLDFNKGVYSHIVKTRVPNSVFSQLSLGEIDTFVFKSGVVTVNSSQMGLLNNTFLYLKFLGV